MLRMVEGKMAKDAWYNHQQTTPPRAAARVKAVAGFIGGIVTVVLIGGAAFAWNSYSNGGLIRALGGITAAELVAEIEKHPGPQGPPGPAGPPGGPGPKGAAPVVTFIPQADANYEKSGAVTGSDARHLCAISKIILRRNIKNPDRSCQLKQGARPDDPWEIIVNTQPAG